MTYNVFGGTLNPTLLLPSDAPQQHDLESPITGNMWFCLPYMFLTESMRLYSISLLEAVEFCSARQLCWSVKFIMIFKRPLEDKESFNF